MPTRSRSRKRGAPVEEAKTVDSDVNEDGGEDQSSRSPEASPRRRSSRRAGRAAAKKLSESRVTVSDDDGDGDSSDDGDDDDFVGPDDDDEEEEEAPKRKRTRGKTSPAKAKSKKTTPAARRATPRTKATPKTTPKATPKGRGTAGAGAASASRKSTAKKAPKSASRSASKKRRRAQADEAADADDVGILVQEGAQPSELFSAMLKGKAAIKKALKAWCSRYESDPREANAELATFVVRCCGSKDTVTSDMLDDHAEAGAQLVESFGEDTETYPLAQSKSKGIADRLVRFVEQFVTSAPPDILFDESLLEPLLDWVTALSTSPARAFRHTSTFFAVKLGSQLLRLASSVADTMNTTEQQVATEKAKGKKSSKEKLKQLQEQTAELQNHQETITWFVQELFRGIIVHRYRDVYEEIRRLTLSELGLWLRESSHLLDDQYLKYFGWSLNDKAASVRADVIQALEGLYGNPACLPKLELFTQKFKARILQTAEDTDDHVVQQSVRLISQLVACDAYTDDDVTKVLYLMFSANRAVASEAGELFCTRVLAPISEGLLEAEADEPPASGRRGKKGRVGKKKRQQDSDDSDQGEEDTEAATKLSSLEKRTMLQTVARLCAEIGQERPDCPLLVVDSLWEHCDVLQDWETYVQLLEQDNVAQQETEQDSTDTSLTPEDETIMCHILHGAALRATGVLQIGHRKARETAATKTNRDDARTALTDVFGRKLPALLQKFGSDVDKLTELSGLVRCFDLDHLAGLRLTKQFTELLAQLSDAVLKRSNEGLIESCSETFLFLCDNASSTLQDKAFQALSDLSDVLLLRLKNVLEQGLPQDPKDEQTYLVKMTLERLSALASHRSLPREPLVDLLQQIGDIALEDDVPDEVLMPTLDLTFSCLAWQLHEVVEGDRGSEAVESLRQARDHCLHLLDRLLTAGSEQIQFQSFQLLVDLCTVFNLGDDDLELVVCVTAAQQQRWYDFVQTALLDPLGSSSLLAEESPATVLPGEWAVRYQALSGWCRLIIMGRVDEAFLAGLLPYYLEDKLVGELVRATLARLREDDRKNHQHRAPQAILAGLQKVYEHETVSLEDAIKLAKRLVLSFGMDGSKIRTEITLMNKLGIDYALTLVEESLPHVSFLEVVREIALKLISQDKLVVDKYLSQVLEKHGVEPVEDDEAWDAYFALSRTLKRQRGGTAVTPGARSTGKTKSTSKRARSSLSSKKAKLSESRRRLSLQAEEVEDDEDDDEDTGGFRWGKSSRKRRPLQPEPVEDDDHEEGDLGNDADWFDSARKVESPAAKRARLREEQRKSAVDAAKRRSSSRLVDQNDEEEEGGDGEGDDDLDVPFSSQRSWLGDKAQKSSRGSLTTYSAGKKRKEGKAHQGRRKPADSQSDDEDEGNLGAELDDVKSSPLVIGSKRRRRKVNLPDTLFDESKDDSANSDDDLVEF
eukprot:m.369590 g.369590  ORF g.369590 m.369590 type:complete len:1435 (-) comp19988_c0_seq3:105-4409(-)